MKKEMKNAAYIDGANLHNGVSGFSWKFDYKKFRIWLRDKHNVDQAYLFLGLIPKYRDLYTQLQEFGFTLIFKEVVYDNLGKVKGNCDVDYASLVRCLMKKEKLETIISPAFAKKCSILLKRTDAKIVFLEDKKSIFERQNKKSPR